MKTLSLFEEKEIKNLCGLCVSAVNNLSAFLPVLPNDAWT